MWISPLHKVINHINLLDIHKNRDDFIFKKLISFKICWYHKFQVISRFLLETAPLWGKKVCKNIWYGRKNKWYHQNKSDIIFQYCKINYFFWYHYSKVIPAYLFRTETVFSTLGGQKRFFSRVSHETKWVPKLKFLIMRA